MNVIVAVPVEIPNKFPSMSILAIEVLLEVQALKGEEGGVPQEGQLRRVVSPTETHPLTRIDCAFEKTGKRINKIQKALDFMSVL